MGELAQNIDLRNRLISAHRRVAVLRAEIEAHPLSSGLPFNPVNFVTGEAVDRQRYLLMPKQERARFHAALLHGIFKNQEALQSDQDNNTLFRKTFEARDVLRAINDELKGKSLFVTAFNGNYRPIETWEKHWWSSPSLFRTKVMEEGIFLGPIDAQIPESGLVFGNGGKFYNQVSIINPETLRPQVSIHISD